MEGGGRREGVSDQDYGLCLVPPISSYLCIILNIS